MSIFVWQGREIITISDILIALEQLESPNEARSFKHAYIIAEREMGTPDPQDVVNENLGYITGYLGNEDAERLQRWLDVEHPILGKFPVSPTEAFQTGAEWIQGDNAHEDPHRQ